MKLHLNILKMNEIAKKLKNIQESILIIKPKNE